MPAQKLRLAYVSGPVDGVSVHEMWTSGRQHGHFGNNYLRQFYQLCSELDAEGYVITTRPGAITRQRVGQFVIENRPSPPNDLGGLRFHLATSLWFLRLLPKLLAFNPNVLVLTALPNYWFLLSPLKQTNRIIVASIHCTLWPKFRPIKASWKMLLKLTSRFLAKATGIMAVSDDIADQIRQVLGGAPVPIEVFYPTYVRGQFTALRPPPTDKTPFRVFFAGRLETNKGIYDLVEVAKLLEKRKPRGFHFDICGEGPEAEALARKIVADGLTDTITCHGLCERDRLLAILERSHAVIVPTTTDFEEGFNKVCAESILAGRPLVTSSVCPALKSVAPASVEVPPDDVPAYAQALLELADNQALYQQKCAASGPLQDKFYNLDNSWDAKLRKLLSVHLPVRLGKTAPMEQIPAQGKIR